jgi:hypothetical protein
MPDVVDPLAMQAAGLTPDQLDLKDEQQQSALEGQQQEQEQGGEAHDQSMQQGKLNMQQQRQQGGKPKPPSNLDKMLLKAIYQRYNHLNGAVGTTKRKRKVK